MRIQDAIAGAGEKQREGRRKRAEDVRKGGTDGDAVSEVSRPGSLLTVEGGCVGDPGEVHGVVQPVSRQVSWSVQGGKNQRLKRRMEFNVPCEAPR